MELCLCGGNGNTGQSSCQTVFENTFGIILLDYKDSDGNINTVDPAVSMDAAFVSAKINEADLTKRWSPVMNLKAVADVRADPLTETIDNLDFPVEQGNRSLVADLIDHGPEYVGQLDERKCKDQGYFEIDQAGNFIGMKTSDGLLAPIKIENGTMFNTLIRATKAPTKQRVRMQLFVGVLEQDKNLRYIKATEIEANLLTIQGLFDLTAIPVGTIITTGATLKLRTRFGSCKDANAVPGLDETDFDLNEVSPTPGAAVLTSLTETATPGTYVAVWVVQAIGDDLRFSVKPATLGFDDTDLEAVPFVITA